MTILLIMMLLVVGIIAMLALFGTTQLTKATLLANGQGLCYTLTGTDDQWDEMKDSVNGLSLYEGMLGQTIQALYGYYTAGSGKVRVRNTLTDRIKMNECLPMVKGQSMIWLERPFKVEDQDVIEVWTSVAGS